MEDFLIFVLCVAVVWLSVKQSLQSDASLRMEELRDLISRLDVEAQ